jgi:hypothetical protein
MEDFMASQTLHGCFGWTSRVLFIAFVAAFAPLSGAANPASEKPAPFAAVVKTVPEIGATDVRPSLDEISVTFNRDMDTDGMSWTGGGEEFPTVDKSREARWIDARTCVLPVRLMKGKFYRVGVNAKSYQNFKSADGTPAAHAVISFATEGAKRSVARKALVPEIVELSPEDGAEGVDPSTKSISVTFNTRMAGGMSWVKSDGPFPGIESGRATWSKDGKACTLPVELQPGETYKLSLNGSHAINFQSDDGVPVAVTLWSFTTKAE